MPVILQVKSSLTGLHCQSGVICSEFWLMLLARESSGMVCMPPLSQQQGIQWQLVTEILNSQRTCSTDFVDYLLFFHNGTAMRLLWNLAWTFMHYFVIPSTCMNWFFFSFFLFILHECFLASVLKIGRRIIGLKIGTNLCFLLFPTGYSNRVTLQFIEINKILFDCFDYFNDNDPSTARGL